MRVAKGMRDGGDVMGREVGQSDGEGAVRQGTGRTGAAIACRPPSRTEVLHSL